MAEPPKHFFNEQIVRAIAQDLRRAHPPLREPAFVEACVANLDGLELTARARHIAEVIPHPLAEFEVRRRR
jgi:hypothetical protein